MDVAAGIGIAGVKISYFAHDIGHPDLSRRVAIMRQGGAAVTVLGFRRTGELNAGPADAIIELGRTRDARFIQRIFAVAKALPRLRRSAHLIDASAVIVARNLEMLFLATIARRLYAPRAALVYECLDIHRLMLSKGLASAVLRQLEHSLLRRCQGLIVSSPGFIKEYFQKSGQSLPRSFIVENKVLAIDGRPFERHRAAPDGPPWRIGWFGVIRCRRSLDMLSRVTRALPGLVEVIIAGRYASTVFSETDFVGIPGISFLGPYADDAALARLFRSVHFAWAVDFYEAGGNSDWLLPNRLYRAAYFGAVPIALAHVETGRWLKGHAAGMLLSEPYEDQIVDLFRGMDVQKFTDATAALGRIQRHALLTEPDECRELVSALSQLGGGQPLLEHDSSRRSRIRS
jgi:succinoglycan biosynthesis protein ExoL